MADVAANVDYLFRFPDQSWPTRFDEEQKARALAILDALRVVPKEFVKANIKANYAPLVTGASYGTILQEGALTSTFINNAEETGDFEPHYLAAYLAMFPPETFQYNFAQWLVQGAQRASDEIRQAAEEASLQEQTSASGFYQSSAQPSLPELSNRGTAILRAARMIQTMRRELEIRSDKPAYTVVSEFIPQINHWRYSLVALMAQNSQDTRSRSEILREYLRWEIELAALIYANADTQRQREDVLQGLRRSRATVQTTDRFGVSKTSQGDGLVESWRRFPGRGSSRETEALLTAYGDGKPKAPPKPDKGGKSSVEDKTKRGGDSDSGIDNVEAEIATTVPALLSSLSVAGGAMENIPESHEDHRPPGEVVMFSLT